MLKSRLVIIFVLGFLILFSAKTINAEEVDKGMERKFNLA